MGWMSVEFFLSRVNGVLERVARKQQADHDGKRARGEAAARMPMGDGREIAAGCKDVRQQTVWMAFAAQGMREIHAHGSHEHHSAAAFAVVGGARRSAAAGVQRGEAGGSRGAAAEKSFLLEQPAHFGASGGY